MIKKVLSGTFESGKKGFIITGEEINLLKNKIVNFEKLLSAYFK